MLGPAATPDTSAGGAQRAPNGHGRQTSRSPGANDMSHWGQSASFCVFVVQTGSFSEEELDLKGTFAQIHSVWNSTAPLIHLNRGIRLHTGDRQGWGWEERKFSFSISHARPGEFFSFLCSHHLKRVCRKTPQTSRLILNLSPGQVTKEKF